MPNFTPARKKTWLVIAALAIFVGVIASAISIRPHAEQPPSVVTVTTQPPSSTAPGAGEPSSAEPNTEPAATSPTPSATGSSDPAEDDGIVVYKSKDGDEGTFLVLAPADADRGSLEYLVNYHLDTFDKLPDLDNIPSNYPYYNELWKVDVSQDVLNHCKRYDKYSTCANTSSATTTR